jgi:hypothetical protein
MTCLGEIRSPLEASVQELCNARLVEVNVHMDDGKPSIPPHDLRSQSASERPSAAADPPPAALATSEERVSPEGQSRSGQIEPCRTDFSDAPSVAVYYRDEEEVRRGFIIALNAMGLEQVEEPPEPAMRPVRAAKP